MENSESSLPTQWLERKGKGGRELQSEFLDSGFLKLRALEIDYSTCTV